MEELLAKFQRLDSVHQQQLLTIVDELLIDQQLKHSKEKLSEWKKRILEVSVWSEDDIAEMEKNAKLFNQWTIPKW